MEMIIDILAIAAGIILLIGGPGLKRHIGFLLFCIWLISVGFASLFGFTNVEFISAIAAIISGMLMILHI
jgi:hypothetical protein